MAQPYVISVWIAPGEAHYLPAYSHKSTVKCFAIVLVPAIAVGRLASSGGHKDAC